MLEDQKANALSAWQNFSSWKTKDVSV
jgi:hypothetical protein